MTVGRHEVLARLVDVLTTPGAPLAVVTGRTGIGRSTMLEAVRQELARRGVSAVDVRLRRDHQTRRLAGLAIVYNRLLDRYLALIAAAGGTVDDELTRPQATPPPRLFTRLLTALAATQQPPVLLLDDAHWLDPSSARSLATILGASGVNRIGVVCAYRAPTAVASAISCSLVGAYRVILRPLRASETASLLTGLLLAEPTPDLCAAVHESCRGVPGFVTALVAEWQRGGTIRVVDHRAYHVPKFLDTVSEDHPVLAQIGPLDPWLGRVLGALAVLHPLADAAPRLVAEATGSDEHRVLTALRRLRADGLLIEGPKPGHWRFRLPVLAATLSASLRPFTARRVAALAVRAVWSGAAANPSPAYLLDQLVHAGRLVDPARAGGELLAGGQQHILTDRPTAQRWLRAAAELLDDPAARAQARYLHAAASLHNADYPEAALSARSGLFLDADRLSAAALTDLAVLYVAGLVGTGELGTMELIAAHHWQSLPGGRAVQLVARATALYLVHRFAEAGELLAANWSDWHGHDPAATSLGTLLHSLSAVLRGRWREFDAALSEPVWDPGRYRTEHVVRLAGALLVCGELARADRLLCDNDVPAARLPRRDRAIRAGLVGQWDDALDLMGASFAEGAMTTPSDVEAARQLAVILIARGRPRLASTLLARLRRGRPCLPHLLAIPEAALAQLFRPQDGRRALVTDGLAQAAAQDVVIGTDELFGQLIMIDLADGAIAEAARHLAEFESAAERAGTDRARLHRLLAVVAGRSDAAAAAEAVELARHRGQPYELAFALSAVCDRGFGSRDELAEAYDLLGGLRAWLARAQLRSMMRRTGMVVAGRQATIVENERLLAALVADGLTNRELATTLRTTAKGIEGRLTRLLQRTGYRSRAELAFSILTGDYPS